jgi:hypothetical protein
MHHSIRSALFCMLLACGAARAAEVVEQSVEATSATVSMGTATGSMSVRSCVECPSRYLVLTSGSRFFLAGAQVTFDELKRQMAATPLFMTVHYRAADNTVTRITASIQ